MLVVLTSERGRNSRRIPSGPSFLRAKGRGCPLTGAGPRPLVHRRPLQAITGAGARQSTRQDTVGAFLESQPSGGGVPMRAVISTLPTPTTKQMISTSAVSGPRWGQCDAPMISLPSTSSVPMPNTKVRSCDRSFATQTPASKRRPAPICSRFAGASGARCAGVEGMSPTKPTTKSPSPTAKAYVLKQAVSPHPPNTLPQRPLERTAFSSAPSRPFSSLSFGTSSSSCPCCQAARDTEAGAATTSTNVKNAAPKGLALRTHPPPDALFTIAASGGTLYRWSWEKKQGPGGRLAEACTRWAVPDASADGSNPGPCRIRYTTF